MKRRSIHNAELRFRDEVWKFEIVRDKHTRRPGLSITQGRRGYIDHRTRLIVWKHHLPAFVAFCRWAITELAELDRPAAGGAETPLEG